MTSSEVESGNKCIVFFLNVNSILQLREKIIRQVIFNVCVIIILQESKQTEKGTAGRSPVNEDFDN
jgi:hypothetical protein